MRLLQRWFRARLLKKERKVRIERYKERRALHALRGY